MTHRTRHRPRRVARRSPAGAGARPDLRRRRQDRRPQRPVEPLRRPRRPGLGGGRPHGGRGLRRRQAKGLKVEIIFADHQNKADVGSQIARQWYDADKVDVIVDVPNSGVALAVNQITRDKGKAFLVSSAASSDLTGKACSPNTVHWTYDTWALANGTGNAVVKTGGDTWFFITADYAFGHALERDVEAVVLKNGGKVLGKVRHPLNTQDFSSFLLQAQASKAKVIGLANAGGDTTNAIKQGAEFGIVKGGQNFAGLLVFLTDVHALGLETAQGLIFTETFYWDMNDKTRAFAKRFAERNRGIHPDHDPRRRLRGRRCTTSRRSRRSRATTAPRSSPR